jgi:TetR/AcrR family fatty acid metabolism transcriptional regulator
MTVHSSPERPDRDRASGDKRERILAAAERIFARHGFFAARVSEIAKEAGVADGTIYLYFKSKDDILISLFEEQMEKVQSVLGAALAGSAPADVKLRSFIGAYMNLVSENRHAAEVITIELRQSAKFMKEYKNPRFADFLKPLAGVIDEGQKDGRFRSDVPAPFAARALFGALDELALMWVTTRGEKVDIRKVAGWIGDLVLQGLVPKGGAP